jgi:hypothetical protein
MRYLETFLKLAFLAASIYFLVTKNVSSVYFVAFLVVCSILGVVLIFNKDASYHFKQTKKDLFLRQLEGIVLLTFPAIISFM